MKQDTFLWYTMNNLSDDAGWCGEHDKSSERREYVAVGSVRFQIFGVDVKVLWAVLVLLVYRRVHRCFELSPALMLLFPSHFEIRPCGWVDRGDRMTSEK